LGLQDLPKKSISRSTQIDTFADLGISKPVVEALRARSITKPFPVQSMVIGDALAGHDLLVQSPTGSGKTLAFGVPLVDLVEQGSQAPQALILAPTRELASQIVEELTALAKARRLRVAAVYGGVAFGPQIAAARRADILVATPGRLEDLIQRGSVELEEVSFLVLDEADRMLDMGFRPAVDRIVDQLPRDRQTLFFSATLEGAAGQAAREYTERPRSHTHADPERAAADIQHRFVAVESQGAKLDHLVEELATAEHGRSLVFVRTKRGADKVVKRLRSRGVDAVAMHGDKSQRQREAALARFERGDVLTLVATDVAARGIDVPDVAQVINFDVPEDRAGYVHRVGRTGRAGRTGTGISFVLDDQMKEMRSITSELGLEFDAQIGAGSEAADGTTTTTGAVQPRNLDPADSRPRRRRRRRRRQTPA
jgi:ATP-dependent RNA helicase RhlE